MKHPKPIPYPLIFGIIAILLLGNIIPVLVLREQAQLTIYSLPPAVIAAGVLLNGLMAVLFKHTANYLSFGTPRKLFLTDELRGGRLFVYREDDPEAIETRMVRTLGT